MFKQYIINKIAGYLGIPNTVMAYWHAFNKVGKQSTGLPKVLMALGARNFFRGLLNRFVIPVNLDWVWPYWVEQQYDPLSPSFVARGFQIGSLNMTHRNWTAIGAMNSAKEAIVDQRGLLVPLIHGWSLDNWVYTNGQLFAPSQLDTVKQYLCQDLPIIITEYQAGNIQVLTENFVEKHDHDDLIFQRVKLVNIGKKAETFSFVCSIRPYNTEGLSLITNLEYKDQKFYVNEHLGIQLSEAPDQVLCNCYDEGDVSLKLGATWDDAILTACPVGFCTGMALYSVTLAPKETKVLSAIIPMEQKLAIKGINQFSVEERFTESIANWRDRLDNRGLRIRVPDERLQAAFQANRAHMLVFHDGDSITPGPFSYHFFWYRDAAYMLNALDKIGFIEEARRVLETYPHRQKKLGHFCSQKGEWDSNGQAIWTLVEHARLTNDNEFLNRVYPSIRGAIKWIARNLSKEKDPLYRGLHRAGISAEHFGSYDVYYWDDFWSLAGLREGIRAAGLLGKDNDVTRFQKIYDRLYESVQTSLSCVAERFGQPIIPISPSPARRMDSAAIGSLSCLYPLQLFDPFDERLDNTLAYLEAHAMPGGGFFHDIMHAGYGTYLTAHVAECYIARRDPRAWDVLNWLLGMATDTFTWPEAMNPQNKGGNMGDGHHGWAAADFLLLVRNMLIKEEDESLVLLAGAPDEWFKTGKEIRLEQAPTHFGTVTIRFKTLRHKHVECIADFNFHKIPEVIEINLSESIKTLLFGEVEYPVQNGKVFVSPKNLPGF